MKRLPPHPPPHFVSRLFEIGSEESSYRDNKNFLLASYQLWWIILHYSAIGRLKADLGNEEARIAAEFRPQEFGGSELPDGIYTQTRPILLLGSQYPQRRPGGTAPPCLPRSAAAH